MRLKRRDVLSLLAGSAAVATLSACDRGFASSEATTTTPTPTPSPTPIPSWSTATAGGSGQLSLLSALFANGDAQQRYTKEVLAGFFDDTKYTCATNYTTSERLLDTIYTGLVGANLADLLMPGVGWVPALQRRNVLREIPDDVADDLQIDDRFLVSCRYQGNLNALPYAMDLSLVGYRADVFESAGVAAPPSTLDDLRSLARELTTTDRSGLDPFGGGLANTWITLVGAYGGALFNEDGTPAFNDETGVEALNFIIGLIKDGSASTDKIPASGSPQLFVSKKAAMVLMASSLWPALNSAGLGDEGHLGLFSMPPAQKGKASCVLQSGTLLAVSNQSQYPDVAFDFCHHALQAAPLRTLLDIVTAVPARSDIVSGSSLESNRILVAGLKNVQDATIALGGSPAWLDLAPVIESQLMAAINGKQSPDTSISNLARVVTDSLAQS